VPKQLRELLSDLRAEIGHSTNVAHGINDRETLLYYINRTQQDLYRDYDWPQLIIDRDVQLADGQRYYPYPTDLSFEDIGHIWVLINTVYNELLYGIGPYEMILWNSDNGFKAWPTQKWMHHADDNTFELWPVPDGTAQANNAIVRLRGTKTVPWMVNDADQCVLPDALITAFAAIPVLRRDSAKDGDAQQARAAELMRRHRVLQASKKRVRPIAIGAGGGDAQSRPGSQPVLGLDYIPPGYGTGPGRGP
jgi:hypothetical protein